MTAVSTIYADYDDVEDPTSFGQQCVIGFSISAQQCDVDAVFSGQHSDWVWIRLANGDLVLAVYPQADTYDVISQRPNMV